MPRAVSHLRTVSSAPALPADAAVQPLGARSLTDVPQPARQAPLLHPGAGLLVLPGACLQMPAAGRTSGKADAAVPPLLSAAAAAAAAAAAPPAASRFWPLTRLIARWQAPRLRYADSLHDILRSGIIDADTTVILDLDDTLIKARNGRYPYDRGAWEMHTEAVEPATASVVRALQHSGLPVFGLTARSVGYRWHVPRITHRQLAHIGVDLRLTSPVPEGTPYLLPYPALTKRGVTYCGANSKGDVFGQIAKKVPMRRAVLIDDGLHNFTSMFAAARAHGIDLTCVYYRHALGAQRRAEDTWDWFWAKYLP